MSVDAKMRKIIGKYVDNILTEVERDASFNFSTAEYAGTNDVVVSVVKTDDLSGEVVAEGSDATFIEFGIGVLRNTMPHPKAAELGMVRGGYGKGHGANPRGWYYVGEAGTAGTGARKYGKRTGRYTSTRTMHTFGHEANMCMYNAAKAARERLNAKH